MKKPFIILTVLGIIGLIYFGWAQYRMGPAGMLDKNWPRPFPYPDPWLNALNDWYDARYPVPPGYIKIHGEIFRVRMTLWWILFVCAGIVSVGIGPSIWRLVREKSTWANVLSKKSHINPDR